jgi:hypothetical protein
VSFHKKKNCKGNEKNKKRVKMSKEMMDLYFLVQLRLQQALDQTGPDFVTTNCGFFVNSGVFHELHDMLNDSMTQRPTCATQLIQPQSPDLGICLKRSK